MNKNDNLFDNKKKVNFVDSNYFELKNEKIDEKDINFKKTNTLELEEIKIDKSNKNKKLKISESFRFDNFEGVIDDIPDYDKFQDYEMPPNWTIADFHYLATKVGKPKITKKEIKEKNIKLCPCCQFPIEKEYPKMCDDPIKLSFLGPGFPLFFNFLQNCFIFFIILMFSSGMSNLITNILGDNCKNNKNSINHKDYCYETLANILSWANKRKNFEASFIESISNLGSVLLLILWFHYFRYSQRSIYEVSDTNIISPADYTIYVKNIPIKENENTEIVKKNLNLLFEKKLIHLFEGKEKYLEIAQINLCYNINEINKLEKEKNVFYDQQMEILLKKNFNIEHLDKVKDFNEILIGKVNEINDKIKNLKEKMRFDNSYFIGKAFITFQLEDQKEKILEDYQYNNENAKEKLMKYDDQTLYIYQASEPSDYLWDNLYTPEKSKFKYRFMGVFFTLIIIIVSFCIIFLVTYVQQYYTSF